MTYKVLDDADLRMGTAADILGQIIKKGGTKEISRMTLDQYADALLENAGYYLPQVAIDNLNELNFETKYDKALKFLSTMPASGVVILTGEENNGRG